MNTVIVTNEIIGPSTNGGIGTFCTHWATLLSQHTDDCVTILYTGPVFIPQEEWIGKYQKQNIRIVSVNIPPTQPDTDIYGDEWIVRRSHAVLEAMPADTDIVYFQENGADNFAFLRQRQFQSPPYPVAVTVLHGCSDWIRQAMQQVTHQFGALNGNFVERYGVQQSDFVLSLSQYMLDWVRAYGWQLPPDECVRVLGGVFLPSMDYTASPAHIPASRFERLVFFGRLETRKGFELFVECVLELQRQSPETLQHISEIVFLGRDAHHRYGTAKQAAALLQATGLNVRVLDTLDTYAAQAFLIKGATNTLVVIPSLMDNHPYAVLEASLIPGLNLICADVGGIPEIVGTTAHTQLFEPQLQTLQSKLKHWLKHGPRLDTELSHYDYHSANQRWLACHQEICMVAGRVRANGNATKPRSRAPSVDVCVVHHNEGEYLPELLASLATQTSNDFGVYVLDDGSSDSHARTTFERMAQKYGPSGWQFITQRRTQGFNRARNILAQQSKGDYLIFLEAHNVAARSMIERFRSCLAAAGHDGLTCYIYGFEGSSPYLTAAHRSLQPPKYLYYPLGNAPEIGILWNCFGSGANFAVRRTALEAVGGFQSEPYPLYHESSFGDYEVLAKLSLAGYRLDVVPEFLIFKRVLPSSPHPLHIELHSSYRLKGIYHTYLQQTNLGHFYSTAYGLGVKVSQLGVLPLSSQHTPISIDDIHNTRWLADHLTWSQVIGGLYHKGLKLIRRVLRLS